MEVLQTILMLAICSFCTTNAKSVAGFNFHTGKGNLSSAGSDARRMTKDESLDGSAEEIINGDKERKKRDSQLQNEVDLCETPIYSSFLARCQYRRLPSKRSLANRSFDLAHSLGNAIKRHLNMTGKVVIVENFFKSLPSYRSYMYNNVHAGETSIPSDKSSESQNSQGEKETRKTTQSDLSSENGHVKDGLSDHDSRTDISNDKEISDNVSQKREHKHDSVEVIGIQNDGRITQLLDDAAHIDQESTQLKKIAQELDMKAGFLRNEAITSAIRAKSAAQSVNKHTFNTTSTDSWDSTLPNVNEVTSPTTGPSSEDAKHAQAAEDSHKFLESSAESNNDTHGQTPEDGHESHTQILEKTHESSDLTTGVNHELSEQTTTDNLESRQQTKEHHPQDSLDLTDQVSSTEEYFPPRKSTDNKFTEADAKEHLANLSKSASTLEDEKGQNTTVNSTLEVRRNQCGYCYRLNNPNLPLGHPCHSCPKLSYGMNSGFVSNMLRPISYDRPLFTGKPSFVESYKPCRPTTHWVGPNTQMHSVYNPLLCNHSLEKESPSPSPMFLESKKVPNSLVAGGSKEIPNSSPLIVEPEKPSTSPAAVEPTETSNSSPVTVESKETPNSSPVVVSLKLPPGGPKKYVLTLKEIVNKTILISDTKKLIKAKEDTNVNEIQTMNGQEDNSLSDMPHIGSMDFREDTEAKEEASIGPEKGMPIKPKKDSPKSKGESSVGTDKGIQIEPKKESSETTNEGIKAEEDTEKLKGKEDTKKGKEDTKKQRNEPKKSKGNTVASPLNDMPPIGNIEPKKDGAPKEPKSESKIDSKLGTEAKAGKVSEPKLESKLNVEGKVDKALEPKIESKFDTEGKEDKTLEPKLESKLDTGAKGEKSLEAKLESKQDSESKTDKAQEDKAGESTIESKLDKEAKGDKAVESKKEGKADSEIKGAVSIDRKLDAPMEMRKGRPPQESKVDYLMKAYPNGEKIENPPHHKEESRLDYPLGSGRHAKRGQNRDALLGIWMDASRNMTPNEGSSKRSDNNKSRPVNAGSKNAMTVKTVGSEDAQIWTEPWTEPILPHYRAKKYQSLCSRSLANKGNYDIDEDCSESHVKTEN